MHIKERQQKSHKIIQLWNFLNYQIWDRKTQEALKIEAGIIHACAVATSDNKLYELFIIILSINLVNRVRAWQKGDIAREREKIRLIKNTNAYNKSYIVECLVIPFLFYFLLYALHFSLTHSLDFFSHLSIKICREEIFCFTFFYSVSAVCAFEGSICIIISCSHWLVPCFNDFDQFTIKNALQAIYQDFFHFLFLKFKRNFKNLLRIFKINYLLNHKGSQLTHL